MLSLDVIEREIANIVQHGNNYEDCARLANLYICKAGLTGSLIMVASGTIEGPEITEESSEFLQAVRRVPPCDCWAVIDELMTVLHAVNPRLYAGVMRKLDQ